MGKHAVAVCRTYKMFLQSVSVSEVGLQSSPPAEMLQQVHGEFTFSVKWRPKRRVASVALCGSIFIATASPLLAVSTGL